MMGTCGMCGILASIFLIGVRFQFSLENQNCANRKTKEKEVIWQLRSRSCIVVFGQEQLHQGEVWLPPNTSMSLPNTPYARC